MARSLAIGGAATVVCVAAWISIRVERVGSTEPEGPPGGAGIVRSEGGGGAELEATDATDPGRGGAREVDDPPAPEPASDGARTPERGGSTPEGAAGGPVPPPSAPEGARADGVAARERYRVELEAIAEEQFRVGRYVETVVGEPPPPAPDPAPGIPAPVRVERPSTDPAGITTLRTTFVHFEEHPRLLELHSSIDD